MPCKSCQLSNNNNIYKKFELSNDTKLEYSKMNRNDPIRISIVSYDALLNSYTITWFLKIWSPIAK